MGIVALIENWDAQAILDLIAVCKSDSGKCGQGLRKAHKALGEHLGELLSEREKDAERYAVIILMRAGLPFGLGIADGLEITGKQVKIFFSSKEKDISDGFYADEFDRIILADAVIESGNSILSLADKIGAADKIVFATNVLSYKAIDKFECRNVYATRISQVSFKGAMQKTVTNGKGPDTGERLFDSTF